MAATAVPLQAASTLADQLVSVFGPRLRAVVVYGAHARPHTRPVRAVVQTLALVDTLSYADLAACAEQGGAWRRLGLDIPLILPAREFAHSLDAFPLEYGDIIAHHIVVHGTDPFEGLAVAPDDLRRACEVQARGHVIHLREGFMAAGQDAGAIAQLIVASAGPFATLMDAFGRVTGAPPHATPDALAAHAERVAGLPASLICRLLALEEDATLEHMDAIHLYPPYLDLMHAIVAVVDGWHTSP
jgi:hypothetical protein